MKKLLFSFDIGHASIGWAALDTTHPHEPELQGCGAVLFPTDDCLASTRRQLRRQRRHIRSTRTRIARMKKLFLHLGVLSQAELDEPGGPWPWKLAARVHAGGDLLSWRELWDVLRWYAHNRGYDGNRKWSRDEEADADDTEKEKAAKALMEKLNKATMCETICAKLQVEPCSEDKKTSSIAYKTSNAAFPRDVVLHEVIDLLNKHVSKLPQVTPALIAALCAEDNSPVDGRAVRDVFKELGFDSRLPGRFVGGLLFGQAVPRFDNRIIGECPVSGEKRPLKNCREFLEFRWAEIVANITVRGTKEGDKEPLTPDQRAKLAEMAREAGGFSAAEFKKAVLEVSGAAFSNAELMMTHPDAEEALVLDPARRFVRTNGMMKAVWDELPQPLQKRITGRWNKQRRVTWAWLLQQPETPHNVEAKLKAAWQDSKRKTRKGDAEPKWEDRVKQGIAPNFASGRAPYGRIVMMRAVDEVMQGRHPREAGGVLEITEERKERERQKEIDELTNNHLVRHRLKILLRLVEDMVKTYADGNPAQVDRCVIEVARDLVEFSGKSNQDTKKLLDVKLKNFTKVSQKLMEDLEGTNIPITAGLIRKARVADDLGWKCPYTGASYDAVTLARGRVDLDHIVPRSQCPSDALESLVITFSEVNKMKRDRTGRCFITEDQGKPVPNSNLTVRTMAQYKTCVEASGLEHKPRRNPRFPFDDMDTKLRLWRRRKNLWLMDYEDKEFTPRDLTVTSHLVRLSARQIEKRFEHLRDAGRIISIPGSVTGVVRKSWGCLGCLAPACPEVMEMRPTQDANRQLILDAEGKPSLSMQVRPKGEIRAITHLHHALDACVIGYASVLIPNNGRLWKQIVTRKVRPHERAAFSQMHGWNKMLRLASPTDSPDEKTTLKLQVADLPRNFKMQITERLKERRVVQHVPADMSGAHLEMNTWRVVRTEGDQVMLRQRTFGPKDIDPETGARKRTTKGAKERASKLVGLKPGKLSALQGALVISENYGVALHPEPTMVAFHQVKKQLEELREKNGGKPVPVLRNGMLIRVDSGEFVGVWRIRSCKQDASKGVLVDLTFTDSVPPPASKVSWCKKDVRLRTLLKAGMVVLDSGYCGVKS
ncbi:MAG: hypothetical protein K9N47_28015 [Prosthecobacter sp.]|uniref:type II CRISPR RNA-guided endonuclease Cas9 n=1 Tax=Prosthecobacter sp. TaxID=1965333 RepID=UPI002639A9E4|nr:type II CRISPR RNA-guided endonuclease Cas9 [Prosthecobacter sp.]MCF7789998.1 hypothetical protein [Prosthecobacter sp.]